MNQEMTRMLAQTLGLTAEQSDALQSGDLSSWVPPSNSGLQNPLMMALASSLFEQGPGDPEPATYEFERKLERARRIVRALKKDLAAVNTILNYVAEIFGACSTCLGQNRFCPQCSGEGGPGSSPILETDLLEWVEPALRTMGLRVIRIDQGDTPETFA